MRKPRTHHQAGRRRSVGRTRDRARGRRTGDRRQEAERSGHAPARLLPQRHPRGGHRRRRERHPGQEARLERRPPAEDLQQRHRRAHGAPGRRARRRVHRPEPDDHRMDPARQGREDRVRGSLGRRLLRRREVDQPRRRPQGQDGCFTAAREHARRRAPQLAEVEGTRDRHGRRRRREDRAAGQRHVARLLPGGQHPGRVGARALGHPPRQRRAAARSWSTRPTCGPRASTSPPSSS